MQKYSNFLPKNYQSFPSSRLFLLWAALRQRTCCTLGLCNISGFKQASPSERCLLLASDRGGYSTGIRHKICCVCTTTTQHSALLCYPPSWLFSVDVQGRPLPSSFWFGVSSAEWHNCSDEILPAGWCDFRFIFLPVFGWDLCRLHRMRCRFTIDSILPLSIGWFRNLLAVVIDCQIGMGCRVGWIGLDIASWLGLALSLPATGYINLMSSGNPSIICTIP